MRHGPLGGDTCPESGNASAPYVIETPPMRCSNKLVLGLEMAWLLFCCDTFVVTDAGAKAITSSSESATRPLFGSRRLVFSEGSSTPSFFSPEQLVEPVRELLGPR